MPTYRSDVATVPIGQLDQSAPELSNWRLDVAQAGLGSVAVVVAGVVLAIGLLLAGVRNTMVFVLLAYGVVVLAAAPFVVLGAMSVSVVWHRNRLARERVGAEVYRLRSELDLDTSGAVSNDELLAFLRYLRHLYHGGATTASEAQRIKVPGAVWQRYRQAIVALGMADEVNRQGGPGFAMREGFHRASWQSIERYVRSRLSGDLVIAGPMRLEDHYSLNVPGENEKAPRSPKGKRGAKREPVTTIDDDAGDYD